MLQTGMAWLDGMRQAHLSRPVTYARGGDSVELAATVGRTVFEIDDGYSGIEKWESRDYLVAAAELVLGGQTVAPQRGDRITDAGQVYEVLAPGKEDVYRPADPYGVTLRVHTKRVAP
jgi:hypothetical protein